MSQFQYDAIVGAESAISFAESTFPVDNEMRLALFRARIAVGHVRERIRAELHEKQMAANCSNEDTRTTGESASTSDERMKKENHGK